MKGPALRSMCAWLGIAIALAGGATTLDDGRLLLAALAGFAVARACDDWGAWRTARRFEAARRTSGLPPSVRQ